MTHVLVAQARALGSFGALQTARASKLIPAVVYGPEITSTPVLVEYVVFEKLLTAVGHNTLIDLTVDKDKFTVVIKAVQRDPKTNAISHVDFFAMSMKKEMEAEVELRFVEEAVAVKDLGGTLLKNKDRLTVRCLPKDLPAYLEVSVAPLKTFADEITVADVVLPGGVTVLNGAEELVAKVTPPLTEEQLKALEAENAADVSQVEVVGKKEEEAAATAEAPAAEKE